MANPKLSSSLQLLLSSLCAQGLADLNNNNTSAGLLLKRIGSTFRINKSGNLVDERILPFEPLPWLIGQCE